MCCLSRENKRAYSICAVTFARTYRLFILKPVKLYVLALKLTVQLVREAVGTNLGYMTVFFTLIYNSR